MKTIALIKKNQCHFDRLEEFAAPLVYRKLETNEKKELKKNLNDYLWSVIEPYVNFIEIKPIDNSTESCETIDDNENFLRVICQSLTECFNDRKTDDFFYHTEGSYSFPKKYIEILRCQPLWKDYKLNQVENINALACLFSLKHNVMENNCVVIANKYDLSKTHFTVIDSVTKEDILRVVRRRFFFSAILIKNNQLVKYYYQDPKYLIQSIYGLTDNDKIEKLSFSHLKYNLVFYFQHIKSKPINEVATRINGLYQMHGDVLVVHEMEDNIFANISIRELKRLNVLSYGRLCDRELKKEEIHDITIPGADENGNETKNKVTPYWSRYIVVENRMIKWQKNKNKCINCYEYMEKPTICDKCYRAKYCSTACVKEFSSYHADECINPKSY